MPQAEAFRRARRAASRAERRLRTRAFLQRLATWLPLPLGYAAGALALMKFGGANPALQRPLLAVGALLALVAIGIALRALLRRPARWAGSLALDEYHGLSDRITTALSLLEHPVAERTALSQAAIEDGLAVVDRLDPRRAVPVPVPRELGVSVLLTALLVGAAWFEVRVTRVLPPPPRFEPLVMAPDDLELFGEIARRMSDKADDPESLAAIRRFNALIEDIAARRLERKEAFERMSDLESELAKSADIDREARDLGLEGLARELARSGLTKDRDCPGRGSECQGHNLENVYLATGEPLKGEYRLRLRLESLGGESPPIRVKLGARLGALSRSYEVELETPESEREIRLKL